MPKQNEIDQTVERIGQLPDGGRVWHNERQYQYEAGKYSTLEVDDLKALCNAYTQLKADLATERQRFYKELLAIYDGDCVGDQQTAFENWFENEFHVEVYVGAAAIGKE